MTMMHSSRRWSQLFLLVLLVLVASFGNVALAEDDPNLSPAQDEEELFEEIAETVEATEVVEEEKSDETIVPESVQQVMDTVQETVDTATETVTKSSNNVVTRVKSGIHGFVNAIVTKSKSLVNKTRNLSKSDLKKVAAAGLGIWGITVGVGYLTQQQQTAPTLSNKKK